MGHTSKDLTEFLDIRTGLLGAHDQQHVTTKEDESNQVVQSSGFDITCYQRSWLVISGAQELLVAQVFLIGFDQTFNQKKRMRRGSAAEGPPRPSCPPSRESA